MENSLTPALLESLSTLRFSYRLLFSVYAAVLAFIAAPDSKQGLSAARVSIAALERELRTGESRVFADMEHQIASAVSDPWPVPVAQASPRPPQGWHPPLPSIPRQLGAIVDYLEGTIQVPLISPKKEDITERLQVLSDLAPPSAVSYDVVRFAQASEFEQKLSAYLAAKSQRAAASSSQEQCVKTADERRYLLRKAVPSF